MIEDNPELLELFALVLGGFGHTVHLAPSGADALALARRNSPDLILADIEMDGIDGFTVLQRLRSMPHLDATPVVAMTAHAMQGDRARILAAGFNGYLSKPINARNLPAQLQSWMDGRTRH